MRVDQKQMWTLIWIALPTVDWRFCTPTVAKETSRPFALFAFREKARRVLCQQCGDSGVKVRSFQEKKTPHM